MTSRKLLKIRFNYTLSIIVFLMILLGNYVSDFTLIKTKLLRLDNRSMFAKCHVVLTRDDKGQSLVLTGEDGKKEGGDQLVISGNNMDGGGDGGQSSNMILQDASNREGDVIMNGRSMIIPGEDGHIVLADSRRDGGDSPPPRQPPPPQLNPFLLWAPFMSRGFGSRMMPFYFGQFG